MTDQEKNNQEEGKCNTSKCCGKKKIILGILIGVLLVGAGFAIAKMCCGAPSMCTYKAGSQEKTDVR